MRSFRCALPPNSGMEESALSLRVICGGSSSLWAHWPQARSVLHFVVHLVFSAHEDFHAYHSPLDGAAPSAQTISKGSKEDRIGIDPGPARPRPRRANARRTGGTSRGLDRFQQADSSRSGFFQGDNPETQLASKLTAGVANGYPCRYWSPGCLS